MSYSVFYRVVYKLNGFTTAHVASNVLRPLHVLCKNLLFTVFNEGAIIHIFALQDDVKSQLRTTAATTTTITTTNYNLQQ